MEAEALLRINAHEEHFVPVELKVQMLMEQAAMRMRASWMVGERISKLDDVVRVRALLGIITRHKNTQEQQQQQLEQVAAAAAAAAAGKPLLSKGNLDDAAEAAAPTELDQPSCAGGEGGCCFPPPDKEELAMFTRMAVAAMKVVLFQISEEAEAGAAKDVFDVYEGLLTTDDLVLDAAEGFPMLDVDNLMSPGHSCHRKLVAARHRFLLRKLGALLDMKDGLDTLLELAADTEASRDSLADVDLSSPEDEEQRRNCLQGGDESASPSRSPGHAAPGAAGPVVVSKAMSTLQNTSWDQEAGNDDATEDETDEETPPLEEHLVQISPSH